MATGLNLGTINNKVRILTSEPDSAGRWSDADLTTIINDCVRSIAVALEFPEGRTTGTSTNGQQEYTLPDTIRVLRVYLAGQPCPPTDIPTLEGDQLELYDQTAANMTPQWITQAAVTYPVTSDLGYPAPTTTPWYPGKRPFYYLRGGNLGFVPPPAGAYAITIDTVPIPPTLAANSDVSTMPLFFLDAIAWKAASQCYFADNNDSQADRALARYDIEIAKLRQWKDSLLGTKRKSAVLLTPRAFYSQPRLPEPWKA